MRYGMSVPPFGPYGDPRGLADLAARAEAAGWDGFFVWDHMVYDPSFHPIADPWVGLAAVALRTRRLTIGTMITPLARRRPWKVARETVSLDRLVVSGSTGPGPGDVTRMAAYAAAGATWWLEDISPWRFGADPEAQWSDQDSAAIEHRVADGPPTFA